MGGDNSASHDTEIALPGPRWSAAYSRAGLSRPKSALLLAVALWLAYDLKELIRPSYRCPDGYLCVPNHVGGSNTNEAPYIEYSDVTSSAAVYRVSKLLKTVRSPYQLVQVYDSDFFGKILTIDGALMITERDEPNYHETLVHTTLAYLPHARRVLVVGGGDGGTVTQLVKHANLLEIVWCELDEVVVQFAKEFFPRQTVALKDPRVTLRVQNAASFVQEARYPVTGVNTNGTFDAILIDSTDFNAAEPLFTAAFYSDCKQILSPGGILAFNVDSPQWGQVRVAAASEQMVGLFKHAHLFQSYQPTYASGHYAFMMASDKVHPFVTPVDWAGWAAKRIQTRYYNPDVHYASFVLYTQLQTVVHAVPRLSQLAASPFPRYDVPGVVGWPVRSSH